MTIERLKKVLALPRLRGFEDLKDFQRHCQHRFPLLPDECKSLYEVLVKLQSLGHDALNTLDTWQRDMAPAECAEFIRFLICVEKMEIDDLLKAA
jgi:hypothetical protein